MMRFCHVGTVALGLAWFAGANGQLALPDPLFQSSIPLDLVLTAPFKEIDQDRDKDAEYAGLLSYIDETGQELRFDVNLEVRGNWRLRKDNCRYSQLWVDFKRSQTPNTIFAEQNRLKLVVQCGTQDRYREYVAKEKQLYDAFAALSELNFDTRLLNMTYVDSEDSDSSRTHLAFFIEHQSRLEDRFEMKEVELNSVDYGDLDPRQSTLVSIFMYLIGNTDYSMIQAAEGDECCHNSKLLVDSAGRYYPIPYDFDSSGFVDASYAPEPNPTFGIRSNRARLFRGYCTSPAQFEAAFAQFEAARTEINTIISDTTHTSERVTRRNASYVDDFFELLGNERQLQREIIDKCRG